MLANRIRADFQLIPNMALPQTLSQLPHSFWATFSWVPVWIHVRHARTPYVFTYHSVTIFQALALAIELQG